MPSIYREIFEIAGRNPDDYIPMSKLNPMYHVYFNSSPLRFYSLSNDLEELYNMNPLLAIKDWYIFGLKRLSVDTGNLFMNEKKTKSDL